MRTFFLLLAALSLASTASAWDTKKFDAKKLEKEWGMPVFSKGVVGNEVTVNDEEREKSAEWALKKIDVKSVVEFYSQKLKTEPSHKSTDDGDEVYTYKFPYDKEKRLLRRVYVKQSSDDRLVHIRFADTKMPEGEDPPEEQ
jgi:hypothetical protein